MNDQLVDKIAEKIGEAVHEVNENSSTEEKSPFCGGWITAGYVAENTIRKYALEIYRVLEQQNAPPPL